MSTLRRLKPLMTEPNSFTIVSEEIRPKANKPWKPKEPFRFFELPSELRNRIYEHALQLPDEVSQYGIVDLHPRNHLLVARRLRLLRTCRRIYQEAYPIFYGRHTFRIFPTHPVFMNAKKPVLTQLPTHYRQAIQTLELRLGPGWGKPPKCQRFNPKLGLRECKNARTLKVMVEIDPSGEIFKGFRIDDSFYTAFASALLEGVLQQCPAIEVVEFDAYPSVKKADPLMTALLGLVNQVGKRISWGPERGWRLRKELDPCELQGLEDALAVVTV